MSAERAVARPSKGRRGLERATSEDINLAKVTLLQHNSNLVKKNKMTPGEFINSVTGKSFGKEVEFIPVIFSKYVDLLKAKENKMVFEGRVFDLNDKKLEGRRFFRDGELKANANQVIAFLSLIDGQIINIAFKTANYKMGKNLTTLATNAGGDLFSQKYKLSSRLEAKGDDSYFVMDVAPAGETTSEEYKQAEALYTAYEQRIEDMHASAPEGEEPIIEEDAEARPKGKIVEATAGPEQQKAPEESGDLLEPAAAPAPEFTRVGVRMEVRGTEDYACPTCKTTRELRVGRLKSVDTETGLKWGQVKGLMCKKCNKLDVVEKLADPAPVAAVAA